VKRSGFHLSLIGDVDHMKSFAARCADFSATRRGRSFSPRRRRAFRREAGSAAAYPLEDPIHGVIAPNLAKCSIVILQGLPGERERLCRSRFDRETSPA